MSNNLRIVFLGSPEFAVPTLRALAGKYPVVGVVTQPDREGGRGRNLIAPPVKRLALELGLPLLQPESLRAPEAIQQLLSWHPDLIVVAAFGQILRMDILDMPEYDCLNVHGSLLPRWRGAAPIHAAILAGDVETGITIMKMDTGVDTGAIISQRLLPILPEDTAGSLSGKMASLGADLILETIPAYLDGTVQLRLQEDNFATYAPMLKKEDGRLDFTRPAEELEHRVRAMNPWPGAFLEWKGAPLKVHRARRVREKSPGAGKRLIVQGYPALGTGNDILLLEEVQPAGKKSMPGKAFLAGARDWCNPKS